MTAPGRPAARPPGLYVHRPTRIRAMQWSGDTADVPALCSYFGRVLDVVDLPGVGLCIPLATRIGTAYALPGDILALDRWGRLSPVAEADFATHYRLKEEQSV